MCTVGTEILASCRLLAGTRELSVTQRESRGTVRMEEVCPGRYTAIQRMTNDGSVTDCAAEIEDSSSSIHGDRQEEALQPELGIRM